MSVQKNFIWKWEVHRVTDGMVMGGDVGGRIAAETAAEDATRSMGFKGTVTTIISPRGKKYYWTPKTRTSGMKWETRE
jgi:hypothetical protein